MANNDINRIIRDDNKNYNIDYNNLTHAELYVSCAHEDENVRGIINELIDTADLNDETVEIIKRFNQYYIPYSIEVRKRFRDGTKVVDHYKFDRSEIINNE